MQPEESREFLRLLENVVHKYTAVENEPWDYGNGVVLSRPETQALMAVENEPGISVTALAKKRGLSKGAVSQVVRRLVDKGMIDKTISPETDTQVCLYLTELGCEEIRLRGENYIKSSEPVVRYLCGLPPENTETLMKTMEHLDSALALRLSEDAEIINCYGETQ